MKISKMFAFVTADSSMYPGHECIHVPVYHSRDAHDMHVGQRETRVYK